jgi:hypothetical protein
MEPLIKDTGNFNYKLRHLKAITLKMREARGGSVWERG